MKAATADDDAAASRPLFGGDWLSHHASSIPPRGGGGGNTSTRLELEDDATEEAAAKRRRLSTLTFILAPMLISIALLFLSSALVPSAVGLGGTFIQTASREFDTMGYVNVSWSAPGWGEGDYIGVYCPPDSKDWEIVDWITVDGKRGWTLVGPLPNYRASYAFRYVRNRDGRALARTGVVEPGTGYDEPTSLRLSFGRISTQVMLQWVSGSSDTPIVIYGTDLETVREGTPDVQTQTGYSTTYAASDMCEAPANMTGPIHYRHPGWIHRVYVDVAPDRRYYYRVGSASHDATEEVRSFLSPLKDGQRARSKDDRTSFFVYGDLDLARQQDRSTTTIARIASDIAAAPDGRYAAIIHIGDLGYACGRGYAWDQFGQMIQEVSQSTPYMVGLGNHEYAHASGGFKPVGGNYGSESNGECGVPYMHRYATPMQGANPLGTQPPYWYSFRSGRTAHIVISTEHDFTPGSEMYAWLESELDSVDRAATPWLFVYGHRPMYCSEDYPADYKVTLMIRGALEPLLARYGVDAYFSGHYHAYERTCRVFQGRCFDGDRGTLHIMVGTGGMDVDTAGYYNKSWSIAAVQTYGYSRVHVHNDSVATIEFMQNHDSAVLDSVTLVSNHQWRIEEPAASPQSLQ
ncbi:hypothetical protein ACHAXT_011632 [Thalassiosira profunda]